MRSLADDGDWRPFLKDIPGLKSLTLAGMKLQNDDLAKLPTIPELRQLVLDDNEIRGDGLVHLKKQPQLIDLSLNHDKDATMLRICDNGIGLSKAKRTSTVPWPRNASGSCSDLSRGRQVSEGRKVFSPGVCDHLGREPRSRRLLVPGVAIRNVGVEDALSDVGVEALIAACRLRERRHAHQHERREQQPEDDSHGGQVRGQVRYLSPARWPR